MKGDEIVSIIRIVFVNIFSMIIFCKMNNIKNINIYKKFFIFVSIGVSSFLYSLCKSKFGIANSVFLLCIVQAMCSKIIFKYKISKAMIGFVISNSIVYILLVISTTLEYIMQIVFRIDIFSINAIVTELIEAIFIFFLLKIRKIKNGLSFFYKDDDYVEITIFNFFLILILLYELIVVYKSIEITMHLLGYYIIIGISLLVVIQKMINMYYKQKLLDDTIEQYKNDIAEKDSEIQRLTEEAFRVHKINHEFYNRQKSLEQMVKDATNNLNIEAGEELEIMSRIKNLTEEHSKQMEENKIVEKLPSTDIKELDNMFAYMQNECIDKNIELKLKVNGNIHYMVNNLIPCNKLETMIGDHLRDAIIAVNCCESSNNEIFAVIGENNSVYELCIYDTGIEFNIDTLSKLGIEPATTHKDIGGTGIGFITTFETLKECKASLEIEEKGPISSSEYTKAVKIIFDGKSEYRIYSYRSEEISKNSIDNRIKVFPLK